VSLEEGQELAKQLRVDFLETSAKEVTNVDILFRKMAENILSRITNQPGDEDSSKGTVNIRQGNRESTTNKSGCDC